MAVSKVIVNGVTKIDVTTDTVATDNLLSGFVATGADGIKVNGAVAAYAGVYTVTPTQSIQILSTSGKTMAHDVTIDPIPSNYGLITWDGSSLTVS